MKRKEHISRARLHKLAKLGIGLAAVTALGGLVATNSPLLGKVTVEAQEVTDQTSTEQAPPASQEAKTVTFALFKGYDWYDFERIQNKVTLLPGESYTFSVDESNYFITPDKKLTYSYDEIEDGRSYFLHLEPKVQVNEDQSVTFEVRTESLYAVGDGVSNYPLEIKEVTLKPGESYTPGTPTFEGYTLSDKIIDSVPDSIVNDGNNTIKGSYKIGYYSANIDRALPAIPADYTGEVITGENDSYGLIVRHIINGQFRQGEYFKIPANTPLAPALFANPHYGQVTGYETQQGYIKELTFNYTYPEDKLPDGSIYKLPAVKGVWNDKITPAPDANNTDTPTTPTTPTEPTEPTKPVEEPKQPETPALEDKQVEDLTSDTSAVAVRVFGSDVAAVDKIVANKEHAPAVLAALPAGYPAQDADLYDIKTLDASGQFVQIGGKAQVTLPVAAERVVEKVIYFLPSTGAVEELPFEWNKETNTVSFMVSHFSHYGIIYKPVLQPVQPPVTPTLPPATTSQEPKAPVQTPPAQLTTTVTQEQAATTTEGKKQLPATGDTASILPSLGIFLGLTGLGLAGKRRRKN